MMDAAKKIEILLARLSPERRAKFLRAAANRTRRLSVVLEDVFQPHNGAAVLRSCDSFGVQEVHVIESRYLLKVSHQVDLGASKWLTIRRHTSPEARPEKRGIPKMTELDETGKANAQMALEDIRRRGYLLAAATLREGAMPLEEVPVDRPLALMIGTELSGLSQTAHESADIHFCMPMLGFAQSLNLSVFAALCLRELSRRMRAHSDAWRLSTQEREELLLHWLRLSVNGADEILRLEE